MSPHTTPDQAPIDLVTIVGAGISGAACAVALRAAGVPVRVVDRGRAAGGRMSSPEVHGRRVDLGAGYFTVADDDFRALVEQWADRGLARPWTDTFEAISPTERRSSSGPMRWATPGGLRTLVRDLLIDVDVRQSAELTAADLDDLAHPVVAMPDPQAARLVTVPDPVAYQPSIAVAVGFDERTWSLTDAAFVNDHPDISFLADDGARRGDGAPVLVAHTTPDRSRQHLDDPDSVAAPVVAALAELIGTPTSARWTHAHRWTFAKPDGQHDEPFGTVARPGREPITLVGDQWCPDGKPRVESAWLSGTRAGQAIAARL